MTDGLKHYGHDELGSVTAISWQWSANMFRAEGDGKIVEVGFYTRDNNFPYTIYIRAEKSSEYSYVTAVESHRRSGGVMVNEGGSYFASSNSPVSSDWTDGKRIATGPFNACVKAFTVPSETQTPSDPDIVKPSITSSGLPDGLTFSNAAIAGTPAAEGKYSVYVSANNAAGSDTRTFTLSITGESNSVTPSPDPTPEPGPHNNCSSFGGMYPLLVLSLYVLMKKR